MGLSRSMFIGIFLYFVKGFWLIWKSLPARSIYFDWIVYFVMRTSACHDEKGRHPKEPPKERILFLKQMFLIS